MQYPSGRKVALGDRVKLWHGQRGIVVCSIDTKEFSPDFPQKDWGYLGHGIVIKTDSGEIFHYTEADEDFELINSATAP
jgi:hypothetical protein